MTETYWVEIIEYETDEVIHRVGPKSEREAERLERAMNINLNHDRFFTQIEDWREIASDNEAASK